MIIDYSLLKRIISTSIRILWIAIDNKALEKPENDVTVIPAHEPKVCIISQNKNSLFNINKMGGRLVASI